jgi:DNA-binding transcriptional MerR regulator
MGSARAAGREPPERRGAETMKIGELAQRVGVSIDTVRFYERRGVLPPAERTASGYRSFTPATVDRLRLARRLQQLGFTLDEVIDALAAHDRGTATCESEQWRLDAVLERIEARIDELRRLRTEVRGVRDACRRGCCALTDAR